MVPLLLACSLLDGREPPPPGDATREATVASTRASCARYDDLPEVRGVCLTKRVVSLASMADMVAICVEAGAWESACRQSWVDEQRRLERLRPDELLVACGPNDDCAFQILDSWPAADVLEQIGRCEAHVGAYASDCVGHALHRWMMARPTPEDAARVLAATTRYADQVGAVFGLSRACGGTLACPDDGHRAAESCRMAAESYRLDPRRCPTR